MIVHLLCHEWILSQCFLPHSVLSFPHYFGLLSLILFFSLPLILFFSLPDSFLSLPHSFGLLSLILFYLSPSFFSSLYPILFCLSLILLGSSHMFFCISVILSLTYSLLSLSIIIICRSLILFCFWLSFLSRIPQSYLNIISLIVPFSHSVIGFSLLLFPSVSLMLISVSPSLSYQPLPRTLCSLVF